MEQTCSYRGFDIVVNAQREASAFGPVIEDTERCVYVVCITLKTGLIAGEWSTVFRVEPVGGCSSADLGEVFGAGFAAGAKVVDDVIGVMCGLLAGRQNGFMTQLQ